jgi:hypothetical protein
MNGPDDQQAPVAGSNGQTDRSAPVDAREQNGQTPSQAGTPPEATPPGATPPAATPPGTTPPGATPGPSVSPTGPQSVLSVNARPLADINRESPLDGAFHIGK